ncbi:hypothetical protein SPI_08185 [Niveomyces insectorum RCEF 264]|uniref:Uncharacterized protein n=1 Tax=Niveomyces insectorum RCEF 264 TaxID=1081102 RepID=A0A167NFD3_9HYPO|nr:hypothetical protein SPI_08185 [Niveomyces insectorum RCEF 264]
MRVTTAADRQPQGGKVQSAKPVGGRDCSFLRDESQDPNGDVETTFNFPSDHVWVETPTSLRFVHQVRHGSTSNVQDEPPASPSTIHSEAVFATAPDTAHGEPTTPVELTEKPSPPVSQFSPGLPSHGPSPIAYDLSLTAAYDGQTTQLESEITGDSPALSYHSNLCIYTPRPPQPLEDPLMGRLLLHYIENLACWLDLSDPRRHFSVSVPHLALTCPILLNSILTLSATHLSRVDQSFDPLIALEYHGSCVHHLIPALQEESLTTEAALPLSTVILRMQEMLNSTDADFQWHLRGCVSLFRFNRNSFRPGSLKHTAFWTYVRQEILTALQNSSTTNIDTSDHTYHIVWKGATDEDWTNQITWLTAKVINFCSGRPELVLASADRWEDLQRDVKSWSARLPETFRPLSIIRDKSPFTMISYLSPWHSGRTLQNATEQEALLKLLRQIEAGTAWPMKRAVQKLEEDWHT